MSYVERRCDIPKIVAKTDGRKVCNDLNFKKYKLNDNCAECPVVTGQLDLHRTKSDFMTNEEKVADRAVTQIIGRGIVAGAHNKEQRNARRDRIF